VYASSRRRVSVGERETDVTSEAMVLTAVSGDERTIDFASLVVAEQARLQRIAARLLRDPDDARDLVQTALADAYERRRSLRDPAAAPAWLRRILVTRALNHLRRRRLWARVRRVFAPEGVEPAAPDPGADVRLAQAQRLAAIDGGIDALPAKQAAAFTLRYLEGLDLDEVAGAMGIGRGTVRTHLHRALVALRSALAGTEDLP
jgi:RNA polymerase sigma-70 factor (ECF subfamily)